VHTGTVHGGREPRQGVAAQWSAPIIPYGGPTDDHPYRRPLRWGARPDGVRTGQTGGVHARSALFDLYGDHLGPRGGQAPVAALVRLLDPLGIAAPAVRTAVSRMVRQGWLDPVSLPAGPGYRLTVRGSTRLEQAASRIYRVGTPTWDGCWHLLVVEHVPQRQARERVRGGLAFLGYGQLADATWVAPWPSPEVDGLLAADGVTAEAFTARHQPGAAPDGSLVGRAWDLDVLAQAYVDWLGTARRIVGDGSPADDRSAFATRSELVHEWRKFLFTDPGLPRELLPADWPGDRAAEFFTTSAERLRPAADRFVDSCLDGSA
jgi:phenylacetic acid degradation operon negative regulatory protein